MLLGGCSAGTLGAPGDALRANATVVRIVDGDTLVADTGGVEERVRLIGIDTPESVDASRPVMCFGDEASRALADLLPGGTPVLLVRDTEPRDRYGRLLAYVYRAADGRFVNLDLVRAGYADAYPYPPNEHHSAELRRAAAAARAEGAGAWSACPHPFEE